MTPINSMLAIANTAASHRDAAAFFVGPFSGAVHLK